MVGTDTAKERIYSRLNQIDAPGAGYSHFPSHYDDEYFEQLASEKKVKKMQKGREVTAWVQIRKRNEALDLRVYNHAALAILKPNLQAISDKLLLRAEKMNNAADAKTGDNNKARRGMRRGSGFVSRGRQV
jgi:phage terminase large subunit GpA-like protein